MISSDVNLKSDNSPVTIADFACQAIVMNDLLSGEKSLALKSTDLTVFPDIPFIAEEEGSDLTEEMASRILEFINEFIPGINREKLFSLLSHPRDNKSKLFWALDPIDGTKGFLRREQYCVALALLENCVPGNV